MSFVRATQTFKIYFSSFKYLELFRKKFDKGSSMFVFFLVKKC